MSRKPPFLAGRVGPAFPAARSRPTVTPGTGAEPGTLKILIEVGASGQATISVNQPVPPIALASILNALVQSQIAAVAQQASLIIDPNRPPATPAVEPAKENDATCDGT